MKDTLKKYADGKILKFCEIHDKIYLNACCICLDMCNWELGCKTCRTRYRTWLPFPDDVAEEIVRYLARTQNNLESQRYSYFSTDCGSR